MTAPAASLFRAGPACRVARDDPGTTIAALLEGAWRVEPGALRLRGPALADALERSESLLLGAGCGALVWRRLAGLPHGPGDASHRYRHAYRYQAPRAAADRQAIAAVVRLLRAEGVEPLLVKGWAMSRHYPELGLRPFGDLDLLVPRDQRAHVERLLLERRSASAELSLATVDLHDALADLPGRSLEELQRRAPLVRIGDGAGTEVRVLADEDHLPLAARHLLRHGAWRPLWLCDVALLVERADASFDWDLCLRGAREDARRVAFVLGLARELLGAELPSTLPASAGRLARAVPRWLLRATLEQWGRRYDRYSDAAMFSAGADPRRLLAAARRRWPNPIEATVSVGAAFDRAPRLPIQIADVVLRTGRAVLRPA